MGWPVATVGGTEAAGSDGDLAHSERLSAGACSAEVNYQVGLEPFVTPGWTIPVGRAQINYPTKFPVIQMIQICQI
jgi:hypothetical protein